MSAENRLRPDAVLERADDVVAQDAGDERVLVPLRANVAELCRVWTLNRTAARIWDLVDGRRTVADIVDGMAAAHEVSREQADAEVQTFLRDLLRENLLREPSGPPSPED